MTGRGMTKKREEDYVLTKTPNTLGGTEQLANLKPLWPFQLFI